MGKRVGEPLYSHLCCSCSTSAPPGIIFGVVAANKGPILKHLEHLRARGASLIVEGHSAEDPPRRGRDVPT